MSLLDRINGYLAEKKDYSLEYEDAKAELEHALIEFGPKSIEVKEAKARLIEIKDKMGMNESFKEIFSKKRFKTDKEVTDWITHLTPGTIVDIDVVGPQSKKVLVKKGTKISSNKKGTTGDDKTIHESEEIKDIIEGMQKRSNAPSNKKELIKDLQDQKAYILKHGKVPPRIGIHRPMNRGEVSDYYGKISDQLEDLLSESILLEDRRADLNYKEKLVKGQIDRVTVELEAHESSVMTKLASRYFSIDKTIKKLMEVKDKMNAGVKERAEALFNAEDIVLTRVVETVSFGLTLSKQMQVAESTVERVNYEKIAKELMALISEDLKPQVDAIIKEATTKTVIPASTKSPSLRITPKNEGFVGDAVDKFKELVARFKNWAKGYDKKLNELKRKL